MSDEESHGDLTLMMLLRNACGDKVSEDAATAFYARYMEKLMSLVERNLATRFAARIDPEDVVQSVMESWFRRTREGRLMPSSRDEVWKLLSTVALCKVRNKVKYHDAKKRAVSRTKANEELLATVPDPCAEEATEFLDVIESAGREMSDKGRRTLELILEGRNVEEIACELGRTTKSVSRYKSEIATVLSKFLDEDLTSVSTDVEPPGRDAT